MRPMVVKDALVQIFLKDAVLEPAKSHLAFAIQKQHADIEQSEQRVRSIFDPAGLPTNGKAHAYCGREGKEVGRMS